MTEGNAYELPERLSSRGLELARLIATGTRDGVAILDADGRLLFWNAAAATITGWSIEDAAARNLPELVKNPAALTEVRDGKWVELRHAPLQSDNETFTIVLFTDSTPQVRLRDTREHFRALGLIDKQTNLPGRELAMAHMERAMALAKRDKRSVGVLCVKLDRFRELRGAAPQEDADETIRQFANRLSAFVRGSDVPARMSEDSFLVVLTALTNSNDAAVVAVRLLLALAEPFDVVGHLRTIHCSIGVAEYPRDADQPTALLGAALGAADRAQVLGGGRFCVASDSERANASG
jgi:diguanylate cyclase (GGDEF)-like protein